MALKDNELIHVVKARAGMDGLNNESFSSLITEINNNNYYTKYGAKVITVGAGGQFATIDAALAWLETQTGMIQVTGMTGTVAVTQNSDVVVGTGTNFLTKIRAGDLINIANDGLGAFNIQGDIYYPVYGNITTETSLVIATGRVGATSASESYTVWRPEKYVLMLLPGTHILSGSYALPEGSNTVIRGIDKNVCVLENANTTTTPISSQRAGYLSINNLTLSRQINGVKITVENITIDSWDTTFINFNFENIIMADTAAAAGNPVSLRGCVLNMHDISGSVFVGTGNFTFDKQVVNDLEFQAFNGGADVCVFNGGSVNMATKEKYYNNLVTERTLGVPTGAIFEFNGMPANKYINISNMVIYDKDQQADAGTHCTQMTGDATTVFNVRNSIIDRGNAFAAGEGGIKAETVTVNLYGVYNRSGAAVVTEGTATFNTIY